MLPQFRKFRDDLVKGGALMLQGVQFPRRTTARSARSDT